MSKPMHNLKGQKFGRLSVVDFAYIKDGKAYWNCLCECGKKIIVNTSHLRANTSKSCGCLRKELAIKRFKTHGMGATRFYGIWHLMKQRCFYKNAVNYKYYGGKGIIICKRWLKFENFRNDMLSSYKKHCKEFGTKQTTIDRIDNNGNYKLSNCRWATYLEQNQNRSI